MTTILRSRRTQHDDTQTVTIVPAQRDEREDHYTWAVNALLESGRTELAYELAAGYRPAA